MPPPQPLPGTTSARVAWRDAERALFPASASVAAVSVRRPRSACHVERVSSLMGRVQTADRRNMSKGTLRRVAMVHGNKDEGLGDEDSE